MDTSFDKLKVDAARHIGIDPDRMSIRATPEPYYFEVKVEGDITLEDEWELRQFLHKHSPIWARWRLKTTIKLR